MSNRDEVEVEKSEKGSRCSEEKSQEDGKSNVKALPSYTAMIAQAILNKATQRSTLSEIYEFMERRFLPLREKGNGWRNCVRHTLSLSDCFMKLHRPENGRSCHWAIHPSYLPRFVRGDYRKRRQSRSRRNNQGAAHEQYAFPQMMYEREANAYGNRMMHVNSASGPSEIPEHSRHYHVPSCAGVSQYSHMPPQGHGYQHHQQSDSPSLYPNPNQYGREYKPNDMYHQFIQNHNSNYQ